MSDFAFIFYSLRSRLFNTFLSVLLTAFGLSIALLVIQFSNHVQKSLNTDGNNIDIVIGAKGSPLQLVLSTIYHIDIPNGNILYDDAKKFINHPQISKAIPLALGDNWKGFRIVGTTDEYIKHYKAEIIQGRNWNKDYEIVIGSSVNLKINNKISGSHGIIEGGSSHSDIKYNVVGIMKPTGTVLDRLILTSLNSVLDIHGLQEIHEHHQNDSHDKHTSHDEPDSHDEHTSHDKHTSHDEHDAHDNKSDHYKNKKDLGSAEITALLITTKSPAANINLPRLINRQSSMQATNPAIEITRLTTMLGLGSKSFSILSSILILIAILSIFSGLASNLDNRKGDLAILRAIGYSKIRIFKIISLEGVIIVTIGIIIGLIISILGFRLLTELVPPLQTSNAILIFDTSFTIVILLVLLSGFIAACLPAYRGAKISVANQLSRNI